MLLLAITPLFAQQQETQQVIADIIEELSAQAEGEQDYSDLTERLQEMAEKPVNINLITAEQLRDMLFLTEFQIASLISYRDSMGTVYTVYELLAVPGYDVIDLKRLQPFVTFEKVEVMKPETMLRGRSQLAMRYRTQVETPVGYSPNYTGSRFLGDKNAYFARYTYKGGKHLQLGMTAEKDPGEPFFDGTFKTGVDYLTGYVQFRDYGWVRNVVVGSFKAGFGQGLTFWNGLSFGKSGSALGVRKRAMGISPHASAYEAQYLQGVGTTLRFGKLDVSAFASYKKIDAGVADTVSAGDLAFTSLPETGYHRTIKEIEKRAALPELVLGANTSYNLKNARLGLTFVHQNITGTDMREPAIYELQPKPTQKTALGFNFDMNLRQHIIFGEVATNFGNSSYAALVGGLFRLSNTVQVSLLGRSYSKTFNTRYTSGLSEGNTANENGAFVGITILPMKGWKLSGYVDLFHFPWMRYGVYAPSNGREILLLSEHSLGSNLTAHVRFRYKQKAGNMSQTLSPTTPVIMNTSTSGRFQLNYDLPSGLALKTTLNAAGYKTDSSAREMGFLITQDVGYKFSRLPLTLKVRFAVFDTPSWSSRIYSYESDMLYSFSVPAYYSKGSRYFVLIKYSPAPWIDIWLRYSQSFFSQLDELGSGAELIKGNTRGEFKAMIRVKF